MASSETKSGHPGDLSTIVLTTLIAFTKKIHKISDFVNFPQTVY